MKPIRTTLVFLTIVAVVVLMAVTGTAQTKEDTITRTFDVKKGGTLTLDTQRGSVEVKTARASKVTVDIYRKVPFGHSKDADEILEDFDIQFNHSGGDVAITAKSRHGWDWFDWGDRLRIHFDITVPETYNLDLETSGGGIRIAELEGEVRCKTSGGSLDIDEIKGDVYGRTSGGRISLAGSDGTVDLRTSGGGIDIGKVTGQVDAHTSGGSIDVGKAGGRVKVSTSGGSIEVEEVRGDISASTSGGSVTATISQQPKDDCSLTTSGGGVTVYLADDIKVDIDAKTSGGSVRCDMPITVQGLMGRNEVQGEINGGGPELYLRSSGGPIRILGL